jgi:AraC family transcriptional regulator
MTLVKPESDPIPELWTQLGQVLAEFGHLPAPNYIGLAWYPPDWSQHGFFYLAAIELAGSLDLAGSPLVLKTIPASTYARFIHKGPRQTLPLTLDYVYQTWLPHSGRKLIQPLELEVYGQESGGIDNSPDAERAILFPVE